MRVVLATLTLICTLAGCGSDGGEVTPAADTVAPPPGVSVATTEPTGEPDWVGEPVNPFAVHLGQCINQYTWTEDDNRHDLTTLVPCTGPHDREVYHEAQFPAEAGAPYPGRDLLEQFADEQCYRFFGPFVGEPYETSRFEIAYTVPPEENYLDPEARYRGVVCYLYDPTGAVLEGSARNTLTE